MRTLFILLLTFSPTAFAMTVGDLNNEFQVLKRAEQRFRVARKISEDERAPKGERDAATAKMAIEQAEVERIKNKTLDSKPEPVPEDDSVTAILRAAKAAKARGK